MTFTDEQIKNMIEGIKDAALPIKYGGSITIHFRDDSNYMDIDVHNKIRIGKNTAEHKGNKNSSKIA